MLAIACLAGYAWLFYAVYLNSKINPGFGICMFKNITGVPCPSCGTTRSLILLANCHFKEAILMNPLGIVLAIMMIMIPILMIFDSVFKRQMLFDWYQKAERIIRIKWIAALLITLISANWIWNIYKNV